VYITLFTLLALVYCTVIKQQLLKQSQPENLSYGQTNPHRTETNRNEKTAHNNRTRTKVLLFVTAEMPNKTKAHL